MRQAAITLRMGAIVLGAVVAYSAAAFAGSVTKADLAGKKICWSGGANITYGKDGYFYSNEEGNGTWRLAGDRLIMVGVAGEYDWTMTKQGGTFHSIGRTLGETGKEYTGKYCN